MPRRKVQPVSELRNAWKKNAVSDVGKRQEPNEDLPFMMKNKDRVWRQFDVEQAEREELTPELFEMSRPNGKK